VFIFVFYSKLLRKKLKISISIKIYFNIIYRKGVILTKNTGFLFF